MEDVAIIGIDPTKYVFRLHGAAARDGGDAPFRGEKR